MVLVLWVDRVNLDNPEVKTIGWNYWDPCLVDQINHWSPCLFENTLLTLNLSLLKHTLVKKKYIITNNTIVRFSFVLAISI